VVGAVDRLWLPNEETLVHLDKLAPGTGRTLCPFPSFGCLSLIIGDKREFSHPEPLDSSNQAEEGCFRVYENR